MTARAIPCACAQRWTAPFGRALVRGALAGALVLVAVACTDGWRPLPEDARPGPEQTLPDAFVHTLTPRGLDRLSSVAWDGLALRYADGLATVIAQRAVHHDSAALALYGPGRVAAWPHALVFSREDGSVRATLRLGDVRGTLPMRTWRASGQELACTARVVLTDAAYGFEITTASDGASAPRVATEVVGALTDGGTSVAYEDCAFTPTEEHSAIAVGRVRAALWAHLDHEWAGALGAAARGALEPRLALAALLPVPPAAGNEAAGRFVFESAATRALAPAADGMATWYSVGLHAAGPSCTTTGATGLAQGDGVTLPDRPVAPDGAPYEESIVLSRALLERVLASAQRAGLLSGRLAAEGDRESGAAAALAALWPTATPAEVARLRSDRFSVRMQLGAEGADGAGAPIFEVRPAPNQGGAAWAPLRIRVGHLHVAVYGALDDLDVRLLTLEARGVQVDLVPESDSDGLVRLRVAALQTERLESRRGLLSLPTPGAAWIKLLLDAALAEQPVLDLALLAAPVPVLAGTEWLNGDSYVLYLRRPVPAR